LLGKTARRRERFARETSSAAITAATCRPNDLLPEMSFEIVPVDGLKPPARNVRKHDPHHIQRLMRSIREFGVRAPLVIDASNRIIDGVAVWEAARRLRLDALPCVRLERLREGEAEALRIAHNRLGELGDWETDDLRAAFIELEDLGFDLTVTGFSFPEIDIILQDDDLGDPSEEASPEPPGVPTSRPGDLWRLGDHLLLCGDALQPDSYTRLLGEDKVDCCFVDAPWNIPIEGFVSGLGKKKHKNFKHAAGELSPAQFEGFVDTFTGHLARRLLDGGVYFSCIDWRSENKIRAAAEKAGFTMINMAVWSKGSGGMGGLYRSAHELIPVFCKGPTPKTNNVKLGRHGRDRTNVWSYPGANKKGSSAGKALADHPTPKPVEMVEDALLDVTLRGDLVLDPFLGSGTTLLAAERCGRIARGIELDPAYIDVAIRRWEEMTGDVAVLADTGMTFAEVSAERGDDQQELGGEDQ
ncbi:MAG: site-specific DNA-methyltransferase, partial [Pseudorhodoplanes sp.]